MINGGEISQKATLRRIGSEVLLSFKGRFKCKGEAVQKLSLTWRSMVLTMVGMLLLLRPRFLVSRRHRWATNPSNGPVDIDDVQIGLPLPQRSSGQLGSLFWTAAVRLGGRDLHLPASTHWRSCGHRHLHGRILHACSLGTLASDEGQNWEIDGALDEQTLTHTEASAANEDRVGRGRRPRKAREPSTGSSATR